MVPGHRAQSGTRTAGPGVRIQTMVLLPQHGRRDEQKARAAWLELPTQVAPYTPDPEHLIWETRACQVSGWLWFSPERLPGSGHRPQGSAPWHSSLSHSWLLSSAEDAEAEKSSRFLPCQGSGRLEPSSQPGECLRPWGRITWNSPIHLALIVVRHAKVNKNQGLLWTGKWHTPTC